jgi:DNA-binding NarL/FixJ family response regulator
MYRAAMLVPRMCAARQLQQILDASNRFSLEATTHAGAFFQEANSANLLLLHHDLADGLALALCQTLASLPQELPIVVVGVPPKRSIIERYYEFGAASYLLCDDPAVTVYAMLENALSGIERAKPSLASRQQSGLA